MARSSSEFPDLKVQYPDTPTPMNGMMMGDRMQAMDDAMMGGRRDTTQVAVSIPLATGVWLNVHTWSRQPGVQVSARALMPLVLMGIAVILVVWWVARQVVGPVRALAKGADRLGCGADSAPLAAAGPKKLRETTRAVNRMQDRLTRLIAERTRMRAVLGHDQRAQAEPATDTDLAALLADLAADAGDRVTLAPSPPVRIPGRAPALRRVLRNLIDNAVGYGGSATLIAGRGRGCCEHHHRRPWPRPAGRQAGGRVRALRAARALAQLRHRSGPRHRPHHRRGPCWNGHAAQPARSRAGSACRASPAQRKNRLSFLLLEPL